MSNEFHFMNEKDINSIVMSMADNILRTSEDLSKICFIGIMKRGDVIAERIKSIIEQKSSVQVPLGKIDINLYRDDLSLIDYHPYIASTDIPFDLNEKEVYLFDDVFFTGRTIRSALNEIMDFGRPARIFLYVMIDRKARELPIQPDFSGVEAKIPKNQNFDVKFKETDNKDEILLIKEAS